MNKDARLVEDMMEAIHRIQEYTTSIADEAEFLEDQKTQDAVIRNLEIIGEAAKGLSTSLRDAHPQIDWRRVAGLRDKLIHDYAGVDPRLVWQVLTTEIPKLRDTLAGISESP